MVEYFKIVLNGVSEDDSLFEKELRKALKWMTKKEVLELKAWVKSHYYQQYGAIIDEVFKPKMAQAS